MNIPGFFSIDAITEDTAIQLHLLLQIFGFVTGEREITKNSFRADLLVCNYTICPPRTVCLIIPKIEVWMVKHNE